MAKAPPAQRICATRGCGRVLSYGTAGGYCRTCYRDRSFAGQQLTQVADITSGWERELRARAQVRLAELEALVRERAALSQQIGQCRAYLAHLNQVLELEGLPVVPVDRKGHP